MLVYLVIHDSGYVSIEHLLLSWCPCQRSLPHIAPMPQTCIVDAVPEKEIVRAGEPQFGEPGFVPKLTGVYCAGSPRL